MRDEQLHSFYLNNNVVILVNGICNSVNNHNCVNVYGTDMYGNPYTIEDCLFNFVIDNNKKKQLFLHISENEIVTSNKW